MANLRQVRSRIRSVQNTQKITRAMQMVAGAKLRRAQEQLYQARPYADRLEAITQRFLRAAPAVAHPLLKTAASPAEEAAEAPEGLVWVGSDTGLCGSYNEKLYSKAREFVFKNKAVVIPIGRKALAAARRSRWKILMHHTDLGGKVTPGFVQELSQKLIAAYQAGAVKNVSLLYTAFQSALVWQPTLGTWLPLIPPLQDPEEAKWQEKWIWEPPAEEIAAQLLPKFAAAKLRRLLLEAMTSEHSARMVAMKAATDNAAQMIDALTLLRNKVRQASITKEISEISAGAEALKQ